METKNGIRESDEKSAESIWDFREKEAGMRDEHPHPPFRPRVISTEMAVTLRMRTTISPGSRSNEQLCTRRQSIHQGKYILGLGKEQNILIYSRFFTNTMEGLGVVEHVVNFLG